jgi:SAM-dependent MidA family methyltransferase
VQPVDDLRRRIAERIRRFGPLTYADYVEAALSDPELGFFTRGGGAGRAGADFLTSPEVGPLYGELVARALDASWDRLGRPDPFVVVEAGAGNGRLAAAVLRAGPACLTALRYVLVERSAGLRAAQAERLTIEPADEALGPFARAADDDADDDDDEDATEAVRGTGPIVSALDDLPGIAVEGVVLANELLDNLPFRVVERTTAGWGEVRVGLGGDDDELVEVLVEAPAALGAEADAVAAGVALDVGVRLPVPVGARDWLGRVAALVRRGEVVLVDYVVDAAALVARGRPDTDGGVGWLRTYRAQARGRGPLEAPGTQDVTVDLPGEYLRAAAERVGFTVAQDLDQAAWLRGLGIDALVDEGAATWRAGAHRGDLAALAGRSRVHEAEALTDPAGLGAHRVLVLRRGLA